MTRTCDEAGGDVTASLITAHTKIPPNSFDTGVGNPTMTTPGGGTSGICTLTASGKTFQFRTNPNSVWWTYELITHVDETYGGRVIQILGTRLGDLSVKIECGSQYNQLNNQQGGWPYLMSVVDYLASLMNTQRVPKPGAAAPGVFEYTTRGWKLGVYALTVPFQDEVTATTREVELQFKIQEDISGFSAKPP